MDTFFRLLLPVMVALVTLVLFAGLFNMLRGGSANMSQKLMRWRVILQFGAILIAMAALYFTGR